MAKRSKADAEKTREQIVAAAKQLFTLNGYKATSILDICGAAGITKGALFHYFKSKEVLFTEIWTDLQSEMDLAARLAAMEARDPNNPYSAFLAGSKTYLEWVARPDYQQVVLIDGPSVFGLTGWYERDNGLGNQNVRSGVNYLAKKGLVAEHRVPALSVMLQNALNGAGFALSRGKKDITPESIFDAFETIVCNLK